MTDEIPDIEVKHSLRGRLVEQFDEDLVDVASDILPRFNKGNKGPEYRVAVAQEFLELRGGPPKRTGATRYRTPDESALDRAFTRVALAYDVCESTVRNACVDQIYRCAEPTERFRSNLSEIHHTLDDSEESGQNF